MSEVLLYPRLPSFEVKPLWEEIGAWDVKRLQAESRREHEGAVYPATGGRRVADEKLQELREQMMSLAGEYGFPEEGSVESRAEFDVEAGHFLVTSTGMVPGEAARDAVWDYLSLVLMPDIVRWRFPTGKLERFRGRARGTFWRLWWRTHILGPEGKDARPLIRALSEDTMVGIIERPQIASDHRLARSIASAAVKAREQGEIPSEALTRQAIKVLRQYLPLLRLEMFTEEEVEEYVTGLFARTRERMLDEL